MTVGQNNMHVEVWKSLGEIALHGSPKFSMRL